MPFINSTHVRCPYCGERIELVVDYSAGEEEYIEDCSVCCRPMVVSVVENDNGKFSVSVRGEDE